MEQKQKRVHSKVKQNSIQIKQFNIKVFFFAILLSFVRAHATQYLPIEFKSTVLNISTYILVFCVFVCCLIEEKKKKLNFVYMTNKTVFFHSVNQLKRTKTLFVCVICSNINIDYLNWYKPLFLIYCCCWF